MSLVITGGRRPGINTIRKSQGVGVRDLSDLLGADANAAPKISIGKFRLALGISAANKGFHQ